MGVISLVGISFMRVVSFYSWSDILMVAIMASSLIALPCLCLPSIVANFSLASCSFLMHLLSSFTFLVFFPLTN